MRIWGLLTWLDWWKKNIIRNAKGSSSFHWVNKSRIKNLLIYLRNSDGKYVIDEW